MKRQIIVMAHNIRSTHNVGSLLRTCEGLGIFKLYFSGYTPYPREKNDARLPHLANKLQRQIDKTALGADKLIEWEYQANIFDIISELRAQNYTICALEQTGSSVQLPAFKAPGRLALIVGREVEGIEQEVLEAVDVCLEIPMAGHKESFNVSVAAAIAMYHVRFFKSNSD